MNFWTKIITRWEDDKLYSFSSWFRIIYLLIPLLIYYVVGDLTEIIQWGVLNVILGRSSEEVLRFATDNAGSVHAIIYSVGTIVSCAVIWPMIRNEITYQEAGSTVSKLDGRKIAILIVTSLAASVGLNYIFYVTGLTGSSDAFREVYESQYSVSFGVGIIVYGLISPLVEEAIFRGIIFNRMKRVFPRILAIIVSAMLFGMFHGNFIQGLYGFLMGLLMVWFYDRYKHFGAPVIIHIVANISVFVLDYMNVL